MKHIVELIRSKMKWKLILVISTLMLFVVSFLGTVSYWQTSKIIKDDVERLSNQVLKQANLNLARHFTGYSKGFLSMSFSAEIEKWLQVRKDNRVDSFIVFQEMRDTYIAPYMYQYPEVISVTLYNANGNEINYSMKYGYRLDYSFENAGLESFMEHDYMVDVRWSNDYYFEGKPIELPVITLTKKVRFGSDTGYIKSDIDLNAALQIINELEIGNNGYGFITNGDGKIIAHPDKSLITSYISDAYFDEVNNRTSGSFFRKESNEIILFRSIDYFDWKTVIVVPYNEFTSSIYFIGKFTIVIAAAALMLSILIAVAISSSFTKRIAKLRRMIKSTARGKLDVSVDIGGNDEVAELGNAYNVMLEDLNNTVNELAESKVAGQKAVLSALQSQIDSHFLYNTLESINSLASLEGHTQIEQTTIALAKMLRYTSEYKSTVVPVEQELGHLSNYLDIMKVRMGDEFEYELTVEDEDGAMSSYCLKAILQPIVENSIKHANVQMDVPLRVKIDVSLINKEDNSYIMMRIVDNGSGFTKEKLGWFTSQLQQITLSPLHHQFNNIGLLNIHFRLQMYYYNDPYAGISLNNLEREGGAEAIVMMPFQSQVMQEVSADVL